MALCLGGLLWAGCQGGPDIEEWCQGPAGVDVVVATGAGAEERLVLEELWRAGGLREGEHLAYPAGAYASRAGRVAIPDFVLARVTVVDGGGLWLGSWLEEGEGPGELSMPAAASWGSDGTLAVLDLPSSKVIVVRDGELVAERPVTREATGPVVASGRLPWAGVQPDGGVLLVPTAEPLEGDRSSGLRTQPLLRVAPGSATVDTLLLDTVRTLAGDRFSGWPLPGEPGLSVAVGPAGAVAVAGMDARYRVLILDRDGRPLRLICRDTPAFAVSNRERGLVRDPEGPPALVGIIRNASPAADPAATGHLFMGAAGRLWVQRNRRAPLSATPLPGVAGAIHDIFDADGTFVGTVTAPEGLHLLTARGDTVWGMGRGELDELWLVALEVRVDPAGTTPGER